MVGTLGVHGRQPCVTRGGPRSVQPVDDPFIYALVFCFFILPLGATLHTGKKNMHVDATCHHTASPRGAVVVDVHVPAKELCVVERAHAPVLT